MLVAHGEMENRQGRRELSPGQTRGTTSSFPGHPHCMPHWFHDSSFLGLTVFSLSPCCSSL